MSAALILIGGFSIFAGLFPWLEPSYWRHVQDAWFIASGVVMIAFGLRMSFVEMEKQ